MSEELKEGYWRCECEVPCNCGDKEKPKKINPPDLMRCGICRTRKDR